MVNATANKYNIKVSLSDDRYADVKMICNGKYTSVDDIGQGGSSGGSGCIRQTGYDLSATVVVAAMLVAAVGACFVVVGKKGLVVSPAE